MIILNKVARSLASIRQEIQEKQPDLLKGTLEEFRQRVCLKTAKTIVLDEAAWKWFEKDWVNN